MNAEDQTTLASQAMVGLEEAAAWHTVGVVCDRGQGIATGIAIRSGSRHMILTAGHVVGKEGAENLLFVFRPAGPLVRAELTELSWQKDLALVPRERVVIRNILRDDCVDLAFLEVSPEAVSQHKVRFFDLQPGSSAPPLGTMVFCRGYPSDIGLPLGEAAKIVAPVGIWAAIQDRSHSAWLDKFDPEKEFLVPYALAEYGKHARGFSGAGVWYHESPPVVWYPNLRLAGICTHYFAESKLLSVVKTEHVFRSLGDLTSGVSS
jgi:hypothetical protein